MEGTGELSSLLADHRIHHQQHLVGLHGGADPHHLLHHLGVDLKATGGVHQQGVEALLLRLGQTSRGNLLWLGLSTEAEHLHIDLSTECFQLLDGGWPVDVGTHHQGTTPLILEVQAQLGCGRGFTRTLQTCHQHHRWRLSRFGQRRVIAPHDLHQLLVHHLDELLIRTDTAHHLGADGLLAHIGNEVLHHWKAHVGLQQGTTHIFQRAFNVGVADLVLAFQPFDRILKPG